MKLEGVTLVCVEGRPDWKPSMRAMAHCLKQELDFGRALYVSPANELPEDPAWKLVDWRECPRMDYHGYNEFILRGLPALIETSHCLLIQSDGFITHPESWDPGFLQYDYIGAPWPRAWFFMGQGRVGNGGFSLRSKRLLDAAARLPYPAACNTCPDVRLEDQVICVGGRPALESQGIVFAPPELAGAFSLDLSQPTEWAVDKPFGRHWQGHDLPEPAGAG